MFQEGCVSVAAAWAAEMRAVWAPAEHADSGRRFWYHTGTGETRWNYPVDEHAHEGAYGRAGGRAGGRGCYGVPLAMRARVRTGGRRGLLASFHR